MADYDSALPIRGSIEDGDAVAAGTTGVPLVGTDGSNYQFVSVDSSGVVNTAFSGSLPAGTNNIGDVDIASALPAGTNNIGDVDIASALPAGDNNIGNVDLASAIPAGTNDIGVVHLTDGTTELDVAVDGSAAKTNGVQILGTDGTNAQILSTDANGYLNVNTDTSPGANSVTYGTANLEKDTATTVVSLAGASTVQKIVCSGTGLMKVEVKYGTTSSEAVIAVLVNSTANPNIEFEFPDGLDVASGETILLSCTNLENAASPASDFSGYGSIVTTA